MNEIRTQVAVLVDGMQDVINDFSEDRLSIDRLAWELKSRIAALRQLADHAWVEELKMIWNQPEVVNAFFIESKREALDLNKRKDVAEILDELRAALQAY